MRDEVSCLGETLAFEHAAKLCREYRSKIKRLKYGIAVLTCGLLALASYTLSVLGVV